MASLGKVLINMVFYILLIIVFICVETVWLYMYIRIDENNFISNNINKAYDECLKQEQKHSEKDMFKINLLNMLDKY